MNGEYCEHEKYFFLIIIFSFKLQIVRMSFAIYCLFVLELVIENKRADDLRLLEVVVDVALKGEASIAICGEDLFD